LGDQSAAGSEEADAGVIEGGDGVTEKGKSPTNVGNDDVGALGRVELERVGLKELDAVGNAVSGGEFAGEVDDVGGVDGEDAASAGAAGEEREDGRASAHFEDDISGADGFGDSLGIRGKTAWVSDHGPESAKGVYIVHLGLPRDSGSRGVWGFEGPGVVGNEIAESW